MKLQRSAFSCTATNEGGKGKEREGEMSRAGGFLVHHITRPLPIKDEGLCY